MKDGGYLTRALNGQSLVFYSSVTWNAIDKTLGNAKFYDTAAQNVKRHFSVGLETKLDGQGRLTIPPNLRQRAGLDKDVTLLAMGDCLEIWDTRRWREYDQANCTPEQVAQSLDILSSRDAATGKADGG